MKRDPMLLPRALGAVGLASLLLYGGMALQRADAPAAETTLYVVATLIGAIAAVWALSRLGEGATPRAVAALLTGLFPIATFLGWIVLGSASGALLGVLWLNLAAGLAAALSIGWTLRTTRRAAGRGRRVPRVG
jgi:peptidoglycan/LPS O-acetylase OafA/YrhL